MKRMLKCYEVTLRTIGPVFVGSGREINKKEYVFLSRGEVGIIDIRRFYMELQRRRKAAEYEQYLLSNSRDDLTRWLKSQKMTVEDIRPYVKYTMDCGDAVLEKGAGRLQVMECLKDPYGQPYIPGTSMKGLLRTILLTQDIMKHSHKYDKSMEKLLHNSYNAEKRQRYLKKEIDEIEASSFRTLNRQGKDIKPNDAVNDYMQGVIVSDTEPVREDKLVLCQKVDVHVDGTERKLPILRECIKPDTELHFTITIDTAISGLGEQEIRNAVSDFARNYEINYARAFPKVFDMKDDCVLLGGGAGFVSKTIIYPLLGKKRGLEVTTNIFDRTKVPKVHKHARDKEYGVSPHVLKCTRYQGELIPMGVCHVKEIKEIEI